MYLLYKVSPSFIIGHSGLNSNFFRWVGPINKADTLSSHLGSPLKTTHRFKTAAQGWKPSPDALSPKELCLSYHLEFVFLPKAWLLHAFWHATWEDCAAQHLPAGFMQSSLVSDPECIPLAHTGLPRKSSCSLVCLPRVGRGGSYCFSTKVMLWRAIGTWSFSWTPQLGLKPCSPWGLQDWVTAFPEDISLHKYRTACEPLANEPFQDIQQTQRAQALQ